MINNNLSFVEDFPTIHFSELVAKEVTNKIQSEYRLKIYTDFFY